jgi:putative ABC transport system permease protein
VLGKLARDASLADAQAELDLISRRLEAQYPDTHRGRGSSVRTLSTAFREDSAGSFVGILQAAAGFVLLIACANLTGLFLARANDRQREVAVRTALGASRMRIARQLVTETVLLAVVASVLALLFARVGLETLRSSMPSDMAQHIEGWSNVRLDSRMVLAIPALAIGLGLILGLIPAFAASRGATAGALKEGGRGAVGGAKRQRIRQSLVVAEIALALALLVAAGLALAGGTRLANQAGGFDPQRLLTFDLPLPDTKYDAPQPRGVLATNLLERIEAVPGVSGAALASVLPAAGWSPSIPFVVEDDPLPDPARHPRAGFRVVSPGFFEAMRIPIVRGRSLTVADREDAPPVALISAALAERFWPGRDPIGRRMRLDDASNAWVTVVGVAGNVTMYNWWDGVDLTAVYVPLHQAPPTGGLSAVVRTHGEPAALTSVIREAVGSVDPLLAVHGVRTMQEAIVASTFGLHFLGTLMGICGGFAVVLSMVGVYSMMAYAVAHRMHEFGVRMALGATPGDVLRLTLKQAGTLTAAGLALGLGLAALLGQLMSSSLSGIIALDATTFVGVSLGLAVISCAAAYVPALRSLRADPATVLRAE